MKSGESAPILVEGDPNRWSVGITRETIEIILKSESLAPPGDMLSVWMFYAYTARWQKTFRVRATVSFVMKGLGLGRDRVRHARAGLIALGLIKDSKGISKQPENYVTVLHLVRGKDIDEQPKFRDMNYHKTRQVSDQSEKGTSQVSDHKCLVTNSQSKCLPSNSHSKCLVSNGETSEKNGVEYDLDKEMDELLSQMSQQ